MTPSTYARDLTRSRFAFTLVELLVVIAIIGILIGLLAPAMQNMREMSRRSVCQQNLNQISLGLASYSSRFGYYPAGSINDSGPIRSEEKGYHHNWISAITPMMDAQNVYDSIDFKVGVYEEANKQVRGLAIPTLRCPSATGVLDYTTCYAGSNSSIETPIDEDTDGIFRLNLPTSPSEIKDGLSYTMIVGEKISSPNEDLGWISGTRSSLRNTGHPINAELQRIRGPLQNRTKATHDYVGGYASDHVGGAYLLMGSGEYRFSSLSMDTRVLAQLASRADGALPSDWQVRVRSKSKVNTDPAKKNGGKSDDEKAQEPDAEKNGTKETPEV